MELPVVTIDPTDFLGFIPEDLFDALNYRGEATKIIRSFCHTVNDFRKGIEVIGYLDAYRLKRMTFCNCTVTMKDGSEFVLKSHKSHENLIGKECTIWITGERRNRIEITKDDIIWTCVKDSDKVFPKCGTELLKVKFGGHGMKNVLQMLNIYDNYVKTFLDTYQKALAKAEVA